jgi:uncharacterized phage-associated protein
MFRALLNDKIGNLVRLYSSRVEHLSLTKLLKLLYLTDETAVRETGTPITWLEYRAWKNGPVPADIYQEIKHNERFAIGTHFISLDDYVKIERTKNPRRDEQEEIFIRPKGETDMGIFSDYEAELFERIIKEYGHLNAKQLVEMLHRQGSLWHKVVEENQLALNFELFQNTSNCIIDFSDLIEDDEMLKMAAHSAFESLYFHKSLYENQLQNENA